MRIPRFLKVWRNWRLLYPWSAASRFGRRLGQPLPRRLMPPWSSRVCATVASCCGPGVKTNVMKWPFPSTRTWILVLNPPWLRPKASRLASLFSSPPRVDEHARWSHPRNEPPSRSGLPHHLALSASPISDPTRPPDASGESGCVHWTTCHSVLAGLARGLPFGRSTPSRLSWFDGHDWVARPWVFPAAAVAPTVPIVRLLVRVVGSSEPV